MDVLLETERLALRRFTAADEDNLVALDSDPEVMRYLSGGRPTPRALIHDVILPRFLRSYENAEGRGVWAASEKATEAFVGWFSFQSPDVDHPDEVSLGYRLLRLAWGEGYATEGARALIRLGFTSLGVQRVVATTYEHNLASRRVMEKAGMTLARRFRMSADDLAAEVTYEASSGGMWDGDDVEYALTRSEWERLEKT